ncbi:NADH dehydrogenase [ubiquinone] 1 subunit C1, mitochondrial [Stigmatopora nigra]
MKVTCFLARSYLFQRAGSRSMFTSSKHDTTSPNWFRVGLAFGSSILIWTLLFKQHRTDVLEYKRRNGLE